MHFPVLVNFRVISSTYLFLTLTIYPNIIKLGINYMRLKVDRCCDVTIRYVNN